MIVFPAIDLLGGDVVRLERGERSLVSVYARDPRAKAEEFRDQGATWVHVVDLSAAFGEDEAARAANDEAIRAICAVPGVRVDVGGGVRGLGRVERLLGYGASRVAMGTALVRSPELAREAAARFGDALVADVAARDGRVQVSGWREDASLLVDDLVGELAQMGFRHLVYTDANRDGMRTGIDAEAYRRLAGVAGFPVVASGGAARLDDVRALAALGDDVVEGVICGRALYEGAFTLPEALRAARGDDDEEGAC